MTGALIAEATRILAPASQNMARFGLNSRARVTNRQTALEPSNATVDRAMSWSIWVNQHNIGTNSMRIFGVQVLSSGNAQYVLQTMAQDFTPSSRNQRLNFTIFTDGSNFISIESTNRFLRSRTTHIGITYTGGETAAGLKMYINAVEDTTANKFMTGTYTGARNDVNNRFMVSRTDSAATEYRGDMRDLAVWNRVLTSAEILEIYNNGSPVTLSSLSFYAGAIISWWPLTANRDSVNNSSYNLADGVSNITFASRPFSPTYESLTFFNSDPTNTRYNAFGGVMWNNPGFDADTRSGTTHLANGKLIQYKFNQSTLSVSSAVDILTDGTYDLRNATFGIVDSGVTMFVARHTHTTGPFVDLLRFASTDGLVGQAFGSGTTMTNTQSIFLFFGKVIEADSFGEYIVPEYEFNTAQTVFEVNIFKRSGGTWNKINVWTGDNTEAYTESCICKVGRDTYFILSRSNVLNGLYLFISTDGANTWSGPFATGLGGGTCMADMAVDPSGKLAVVFADRSDARLKLTHSNPIADIIADPTDWKNLGDIFQSYPTDSTTILGYPSIAFYGWKVCITTSAELSSSRADLYFGYGLIV